MFYRDYAAEDYNYAQSALCWMRRSVLKLEYYAPKYAKADATYDAIVHNKELRDSDGCEYFNQS